MLTSLLLLLLFQAAPAAAELMRLCHLLVRSTLLLVAAVALLVASVDARFLAPEGTYHLLGSKDSHWSHQISLPLLWCRLRGGVAPTPAVDTCCQHNATARGTMLPVRIVLQRRFSQYTPPTTTTHTARSPLGASR